MRKHHRHSRCYRMRRWIRHNSKAFLGSSVIIMVAVLVAGNILYRSYQKQNSMHVTSGNSIDMKDGYRTIEYNGKEYQYNTQMLTILYAEIDSEGKMQADTMYGNKARVLNTSLLILDKKKEKINIITLDNETISKMHSYSEDGRDMGLVSGMLRDAYSYGDGGKVSCENLKETVEKLLDGITINEYVVANRSSKEQIKELADGLMAYIGELSKKFQEDPDLLINEGKIADEYLQTSITKNKYQSIAQAIDKTSEGLVDYYQLQGKTEKNGNEEFFYPDEQQLKQLIIDLFYIEI